MRLAENAARRVLKIARERYGGLQRWSIDTKVDAQIYILRGGTRSTFVSGRAIDRHTMGEIYQHQVGTHVEGRARKRESVVGEQQERSRDTCSM